MTRTDYDQKKRECWKKFFKEHGVDDREIPDMEDDFSQFFDRAFALGKQEKEAEETKIDGKITISLHVAVIPRQEEFYMGVDASHEAYTIDIPKSMIPSDLLAVINGECKNKVVTNIAIMK